VIASLLGMLKQLSDESAIVEVGGVGYEVSVSRTTREALPGVGQEVFFHTHLHVREDEMRLFGFGTLEEKRLFLLLIGLPKVGVKTAMDILSTHSVSAFRKIVLQGDLTRMTQVPGVGRKTAERILFELKERLEALPEPAELHRPAVVEDNLFDQAVQGLVYLGCKYPVAVRAIQQAAEQIGADAALEDLIREGLKYR